MVDIVTGGGPRRQPVVASSARRRVRAQALIGLAAIGLVLFAGIVGPRIAPAPTDPSQTPDGSPTAVPVSDRGCVPLRPGEAVSGVHLAAGPDPIGRGGVIGAVHALPPASEVPGRGWQVPPADDAIDLVGPLRIELTPGACIRMWQAVAVDASTGPIGLTDQVDLGTHLVNPASADVFVWAPPPGDWAYRLTVEFWTGSDDRAWVETFFRLRVSGY